MTSAAASFLVGPLGAYLLVVVLMLAVVVPAAAVAQLRAGRGPGGERWGRAPAVAGLAGTTALLGATAAVAGERPWAVPLTLAIVSLLFVLATLRQIVGAGEARHGRRTDPGRADQASDDHHRLLADLLDRSVEDRRRFARHLHEQAMAAYAAFATLAGACRSPSPPGLQQIAAEATTLVGEEMGRRAELLRDLVRAIRPAGSERDPRPRLGPPIAAYHDSLYDPAGGDSPAPVLTVTVDDTLVLDWVAETVLLHVAQEALHNVRRHSRARSVDVTVEPDRGGSGGTAGSRGTAGDGVRLRVVDDGAGFDTGTTAEGSGLTAMRAAVAAVGGTVTIESRPGHGTTVSVRVGSRTPSSEIAYLRSPVPVS